MESNDQLTKFQSQICGRLITPKTQDYDSSRAYYNGMMNIRPTLIQNIAPSKL